MTFAFEFANREAVKHGPVGAPALSIHSGLHRD
jgi:hypothetical protein